MEGLTPNSQTERSQSSRRLIDLGFEFANESASTDGVFFVAAQDVQHEITSVLAGLAVQ
jgi:hypothetical protein